MSNLKMWYTKEVNYGQIVLKVSMEREYAPGQELSTAHATDELIDEMMQSSLTKVRAGKSKAAQLPEPTDNEAPKQTKKTRKKRTKKSAAKEQTPPPKEPAHTEPTIQEPSHPMVPQEIADMTAEQCKDIIVYEYALSSPQAKELTAQLDQAKESNDETKIKGLKTQLAQQFIVPFLLNTFNMSAQDFKNIKREHAQALVLMLKEKGE